MRPLALVVWSPHMSSSAGPGSCCVVSTPARLRVRQNPAVKSSWRSGALSLLQPRSYMRSDKRWDRHARTCGESHSGAQTPDQRDDTLSPAARRTSKRAAWPPTRTTTHKLSIGESASPVSTSRRLTAAALILMFPPFPSQWRDMGRPRAGFSEARRP